MRRDGRRRADDPRRRWQQPAAIAVERTRGSEPAQRGAARRCCAATRPPCATPGPQLLRALAKQPLLYVALARGGNPQRIVASREPPDVLRRLLAYLPRLGLLAETCQLLETAQQHGGRASASGPARSPSSTACSRSAARRSSTAWSSRRTSGPPRKIGRRRSTPTAELIDCLEQIVEVLLALLARRTAAACGSRCWKPSATTTAGDDLKQFIERYGGDLFTQRFMNLGNLRGILHQGVRGWLQTLAEEPDDEEESSACSAELDGRSIPRRGRRTGST